MALPKNRQQTMQQDKNTSHSYENQNSPSPTTWTFTQLVKFLQLNNIPLPPSLGRPNVMGVVVEIWNCRGRCLYPNSILPIGFLKKYMEGSDKEEVDYTSKEKGETMKDFLSLF